MNYLIMECHPGYAIALDEDGRFLRVANLHYEVGQTVSSVIEMQQPKTSRGNGKKWHATLVTMAACLCIAVLGVWQYLSLPYGSVRMQINPDVLLSVSRLDYVVDVEGLNEDGRSLIAGYQYKGKKVEQVTDQLADLAVEQGYLTEGGAIRLTVESEDEAWRVVTEDRILLELEIHLGGSVTVSAASAAAQTPAQPNAPAQSNTPAQPEAPAQPETPSVPVQESQTIVIPITPENDSGYGDNAYGDSGYADDSFGDSAYGGITPDDGDSGYGDVLTDNGSGNYDDASSDDGGSNYDSVIVPDDGNSNYGDTVIPDSRNTAGSGDSGYGSATVPDNGSSNYGDTVIPDSGDSAYGDADVSDSESNDYDDDSSDDSDDD